MPNTDQPQRTANALVSQLQSDNFNLFDAIGRWRGIAESTLPVIVFILAFTFTHNLWITAALSTALSLIFIFARLISKDNITSALSGTFGILVGLVIALWSGHEENFFLVGLINAALFTLTMILTITIGRPAAGIALDTVWKLPAGWMKNDHYAALYKRCKNVTWLWAAMFILRFLAQLPLWLAGNTQGLATAKLILGLPLFAIVVALTWYLLRPYAYLAQKTPQDKDKA